VWPTNSGSRRQPTSISFSGAPTRRFARSGSDKYTLIINLKTAKALGLTISREMMLIADELLE
jgi:hypothetical protein